MALDLGGLPASVEVGCERVRDVVLLRHHPVEPVDVLVPLHDVVGERRRLGLQGEDGVLQHRADDEVHPAEALLGVEFRGIRQVLDDEGGPSFLDDFRPDDQMAELPRDPTDKWARGADGIGSR